MSSGSIESAGGDKSSNAGLSGFTVLPEQPGVGPRVQKPEAMKQQPSALDRTLSERFHRERGRRRPGVLEGPFRVQRLNWPKNPGEQRGEAEPSKPNAAEQQTPQRRRTRRELARLAQDPELRGLAKELFGGITDEAASEFIALAVRDFPELTPDEALRKFDRDSRENPNRGFTFS